MIMTMTVKLMSLIISHDDIVVIFRVFEDLWYIGLISDFYRVCSEKCLSTVMLLWTGSFLIWCTTYVTKTRPLLLYS